MLARTIIVAVILLVLSDAAQAGDKPSVRIFRVLDGGVQPQAVVDAQQVVHLIYLKGDSQHTDIFYVHSGDGGDSFSPPIRVNSQQGSAMSMGTVRGAHLAVGAGGKLHVAWPGSMIAEPKALGKAQPMLYTRLADDGVSFEAQRNLIQAYPGLDGGGSVAADQKGNVYVAWHSPSNKEEHEQGRRIWLSRSTDGGSTFSSEQSISSATGVCGCCGMRLFVGGDGEIYTLYRSADQMIHRNMTLLRLSPTAAKAQSQIVGKMDSAMCTMSTAAFAASTNDQVVAGWETSGQIYWSDLDAKNGC